MCAKKLKCIRQHLQNLALFPSRTCFKIRCRRVRATSAKSRYCLYCCFPTVLVVMLQCSGVQYTFVCSTGTSVYLQERVQNGNLEQVSTPQVLKTAKLSTIPKSPNLQISRRSSKINLKIRDFHRPPPTPIPPYSNSAYRLSGPCCNGMYISKIRLTLGDIYTLSLGGSRYLQAGKARLDEYQNPSYCTHPRYHVGFSYSQGAQSVG